MIIAVDFDGTVVEHAYPKVGYENPGATEWLRRYEHAGARLILLTMRSGEHLEEAKHWFLARQLRLWAVNENPEQTEWADSRKVYANVYIDDAAACTPLRPPITPGLRPMVDWRVVGPEVMKKVEERL